MSVICIQSGLKVIENHHNVHHRWSTLLTKCKSNVCVMLNISNLVQWFIIVSQNHSTCSHMTYSLLRGSTDNNKYWEIIIYLHANIYNSPPFTQTCSEQRKSTETALAPEVGQESVGQTMLPMVTIPITSKTSITEMLYFGSFPFTDT